MNLARKNPGEPLPPQVILECEKHGWVWWNECLLCLIAHYSYYYPDLLSTMHEYEQELKLKELQAR